MEVSMAERKTARELIETGLSDTERLISQKQYSLAMIKARQTLEYISRSLCRKNGLPEGELIDMVDDLYRQGIITRDSCTHFHKIRMLGEAALQNGDNNAYNASNAYQLLTPSGRSAVVLPQSGKAAPPGKDTLVRRLSPSIF